MARFSGYNSDASSPGRTEDSVDVLLRHFPGVFFSGNRGVVAGRSQRHSGKLAMEQRLLKIEIFAFAIVTSAECC